MLLVAKRAHQIRSCTDQTDHRRYRQGKREDRHRPSRYMSALPGEIRFRVDRKT